YLLAPFRNERHLVRSEAKRDADHLVGARHLEVEHGRDRRRQPLDVAILNVSAILSQVRCDTIRTALLAHQRALHRVGARAAPRLADGRDVVDVDVQALPLHVADLAVGAARARQMLLRWKPVVYVAATPRSRTRGRREETNRRS